MKSLLTFALLVCCATYAQAELKLLQVVFRHGDRAPDSNGLETFPTDVHKDDTFDPVLRGGLTNEGKMREFTLGAYLRKIYGEFLGDTYYPYEVKARSTNVDRTKMSLQLMLAALYPPKKKQIWNPQLDWQPIPATYVPGLDDNLMAPEECPQYLFARERAEQSDEFQRKLSNFQLFMKKLSSATGLNITDSNQMYFLYHTLMAEKSMNLTLPKWAKDIFPNGKLLDGINLEYEIFSFNAEMRRLNGGMFIKEFTDNMVGHDKKRKINIYSGHETNVAAVLQALGVYKPHVPAYSSAVIVELHEENHEHYMKVKYYTGIPSKHIDLNIPGCGVKCTLRQFQIATHKVYPSKLETICNKRIIPEILAHRPIKIAPGILYQILSSIENERKTKSESPQYSVIMN